MQCMPCIHGGYASYNQRWSRGHKARGQGQGHEKFRGQGQRQTHSRPRPRSKETDASVLKKKGLQNFFQAISKTRGLQNFFSGDLYLKKPKKRSLQIFCTVSGVFQRNFNGSKIVLSSELRLRGQGQRL